MINSRACSMALAGAAVLLCVVLVSLGLMGAGSVVWVILALSRLVRSWL